MTHGQWYFTEKGPKLMDTSYRRGWYNRGFDRVLKNGGKAGMVLATRTVTSNSNKLPVAGYMSQYSEVSK